MSDIVETTYKCAKCGAEDHDRSSHPAPAVLNCWKCGAGRGMDTSQMIQTGNGMFPSNRGPKGIVQEG